MRKIYTVALAAAVCVSAGAATRQQAANQVIPAQKTAYAVAPALEKIEKADMAPAARKSPARTASLADLEGTYQLTFEWLLQSTVTSWEIELTVDDEATGAVTLAGFPQDYSVKGTVDLAAGTLTIANDQNLGPDSNGDQNYFYLKAISVQGYLESGKSDQETTVGKISGTTITFTPSDVWAIGDYNDESLGYWWMSYVNVMDSASGDTPVTDPNEGWTSLGQATMQDGWVLPAFGLDQTKKENWYEVELQQNDENKNLYRLVDPYFGNFPYAMANTSTAEHGYIVFDLTDPDHVVFQPVDAAFANAQLEVSKFYPMNTLTWAVDYLGYDASYIVSQAGDDFVYTTFADGILTLSSTYGPMTDEYGNTIYSWDNDACFGVQGAIFGGYGWMESDDTAVNMETRIAFPGYTFNGVSSAIADQSEAPVEYFNLQGTRVTAPAAGSIVIKRQGAAVSKVFVK